MKYKILRVCIAFGQISRVRSNVTSMWFLPLTLACSNCNQRLSYCNFKATFTWDQIVQIRLVSDPLWHGSTLFARDRFKTGTAWFHIGSLS